MSGRALLLDQAAGLTATATQLPALQGGATTAQQANFFAEITTAASTNATWTISLRVTSPNGNPVEVASGTIDAGDAAGTMAELTKVAGFTGVNDAVPFPDSILYTETSAGSSLTADVFVVWS